MTVLMTVTASAPASSTAPAIDVMSVTFGLSFAQRGRPQPAVASIAAAARAGIVREHLATVLNVRAAQVDLDRDDLGPTQVASASAAAL